MPCLQTRPFFVERKARDRIGPSRRHGGEKGSASEIPRGFPATAGASRRSACRTTPERSAGHTMDRTWRTYSARIQDRWHEVVRYDNFHGFLHRQRFWRSEQPERVPAHERTSIRILVG